MAQAYLLSSYFLLTNLSIYLKRYIYKCLETPENSKNHFYLDGIKVELEIHDYFRFKDLKLDKNEIIDFKAKINLGEIWCFSRKTYPRLTKVFTETVIQFAKILSCELIF